MNQIIFVFGWMFCKGIWLQEQLIPLYFICFASTVNGSRCKAIQASRKAILLTPGRSRVFCISTRHLRPLRASPQSSHVLAPTTPPPPVPAHGGSRLIFLAWCQRLSCVHRLVGLLYTYCTWRHISRTRFLPPSSPNPRSIIASAAVGPAVYLQTYDHVMVQRW